MFTNFAPVDSITKYQQIIFFGKVCFLETFDTLMEHERDMRPEADLHIADIFCEIVNKSFNWHSVQTRSVPSV